MKNLFLKRSIVLLLIIFSLVCSLDTVSASWLKCSFALTNNKRLLHSNNFNIHRGFNDYVKAFGPSFVDQVDYLRRQDVWVDFGAGEARAQLGSIGKLHTNDHPEILEWNGKMLALGVVKPEWDWTNPIDKKFYQVEEEMIAAKRFEYREGYLEDMPISELPTYRLGTDFYGALSYSTRISEVLERQIHRLEVELGLLFVETDVLNTKITDRSGHTRNFVEWLKTIPGIEVIQGSSVDRFAIRRVASRFSVPQLKLSSIVSRKPPRRQFIEVP
jgi:hypothetical protein